MTKPTRSAEPSRDEDPRPEDVEKRIRELAQLYRLGMSLRSGRWLGSRADVLERDADG